MVFQGSPFSRLVFLLILICTPIFAEENKQFKAIIFTNQPGMCKMLSVSFLLANIPSSALDLDCSGDQVFRALMKTKNKRVHILIVYGSTLTDHGMSSITNLDLVLYYDLPDTLDAYISHIENIKHRKRITYVSTQKDQMLVEKMKEVGLILCYQDLIEFSGILKYRSLPSCWITEYYFYRYCRWTRSWNYEWRICR